MFALLPTCASVSWVPVAGTLGVWKPGVPSQLFTYRQTRQLQHPLQQFDSDLPAAASCSLLAGAELLRFLGASTEGSWFGTRPFGAPALSFQWEPASRRLPSANAVSESIPVTQLVASPRGLPACGLEMQRQKLSRWDLHCKGSPQRKTLVHL